MRTVSAVNCCLINAVSLERASGGMDGSQGVSSPWGRVDSGRFRVHLPCPPHIYPKWTQNTPEVPIQEPHHSWLLLQEEKSFQKIAHLD